MSEMDCVELVERVTDCLEEALAPEELMKLLDHLQICKGCDAYFNEVLVTLKVMSHLPAKPLPADLEQNLLAVYRDWAESAVA
jgi:predicted anti-sigma-YlaC factor YlaD